MPSSTNAFEPRQVTLELLAGATSGTPLRLCCLSPSVPSVPLPLAMSCVLLPCLFCGRIKTEPLRQALRAQLSGNRWTLFACVCRRKERERLPPLSRPRPWPL